MDLYEVLKLRRKAYRPRVEGLATKKEMLTARNKKRRKLTGNQAREIRIRRWVKDEPCSTIARDFPVVSQTIDSLVHYRTYDDYGGPCCKECNMHNDDEFECVINHKK